MKVVEVRAESAEGCCTYRSGKEKFSPVISLFPLGNRYFEVSSDFRVRITLDNGAVFDYLFRKGFVTNFRSGGLLVDAFIDPIGDQLHQLCWIVHDGNYTPCDCVLMCGLRANDGIHPVSKKTADELLRAMLVFSGTSKFKADVIKRSVSWFGGSAYDEDDSLTPTNRTLFEFSMEVPVAA